MIKEKNTVIPELKRLKKENHEFRDSLFYIMRCCLKERKGLRGFG
jgi:hypothetical protein